jgi:hypothetical protein
MSLSPLVSQTLRFDAIARFGLLCRIELHEACP